MIYDAAHGFGVTYRGKSLFEYGDVSTCSFHATKLFHTGEGGALFCNDETLNRRLYQSHNFGHKGQLEFHGLGINGKDTTAWSMTNELLIRICDATTSENNFPFLGLSAKKHLKIRLRALASFSFL